MGSDHPLLGAEVLAAIERAATAHRGRPWISQGFTSLDDRASHPCGILHGTPFSVFAKLSPAAEAREQFTAELAGLRLLHQAARVAVPVPVASGLAGTPTGAPAGALLHGDAQQNNFVSTPAGAVVIDPAPYFGHPEADLALVGYFQPVPGEVFTAYRDIAPIDQGFAERRELWRLPAYLAVVTVDGSGLFGRRYLDRLAAAVRSYR